MKKLKNEIKAIVFDVGGVLCPEGGNLREYEKLSNRFGFDTEKFHKAKRRYIKSALKTRKPLFKYEISIAKNLGIDPKKFIYYWQDLRKHNIKFFKETQKILRVLKRNYILGTLTNVTHGHDIIRKKNAIYIPFEMNIKSCDLGSSKPSLRIFKHLLNKMKKKHIVSKEIIFVDDKERNLIPAKSLGMKTILFKNNKQLVKDLRKLGVKI